MSSLLLHYALPLLHSFFILSSPFLAFRVMYGPCQHWNQWDASCFNLASEPSGSRSSASWKSDGAGLSLPCLHSPPNALPCCIDQHLAPTGQGFADAYTIWTPQRLSEFTSCVFTLSVFLSLPVITSGDAAHIPHSQRNTTNAVSSPELRHDDDLAETWSSGWMDKQLRTDWKAKAWLISHISHDSSSSPTVSHHFPPFHHLPFIATHH